MTPYSHRQATADDATFARMVAHPSLRSVAGATRRESRRRDITRIASTLFCSTGIDPSIVSFAKDRAAAFWGLDEEQIDVLVATRLLGKMSRLMLDLPATSPWSVDADLPAAA